MRDRRISRRQILKLAGAAGAVGMVGVPGVAFAAEDSDEKHLFIGFDLQGTGPGSTAGPFVMSGRFQDFGNSTAHNITLVPIRNSDRARLSGDQQFAGQQGTILTHFKGVAFPTTSPHGVGEGSFVILSGTRAYAGIRGRGSFLIVTDQSSNHFIGTETGNVES